MSGAPREILVVDGLRTTYGSGASAVAAVRGVDLRVNAGQILGIVGESGCGKSTAIRSAIGLTMRDQAAVDGRSRLYAADADPVDLLAATPGQLRRIRGRDIGFIAQNPFSLLHPTVRIDRQFRRYMRAHRDVTRAAADELMLESLAAVGMSDPARVSRSFAHELSGGMAQRAVIALATALRPSLVVADEPTTGLDVSIQKRVLDTLKDRVLRNGSGCLLVTHDLGVIANYATDVAVMYAGRIVEVGPTRHVLDSPQHPYTVGLLAALPKRGEQLSTIPGAPPVVHPRDRGCQFRARCSRARDICNDDPALARLDGSDVAVACHFPGGAHG